MNNYVFLFRTKAADDRDCCAYIDIDDLKAVHKGCDGKFNVHGACYSASLGGKYADYQYSEIDTILTENQYNRLVNPADDDLFNDVIEALTSEEAENYFDMRPIPPIMTSTFSVSSRTRCIGARRREG